MNRLKSAALGAVACAALFVAVPATQAQTTTTGQTSTTATAAKAKLTVSTGKITDLAADHITIQPATGAAKRFTLGANAAFVARSYDAARAGLKEGDYARIAAGEDNVAHRVEFALQAFGKGSANNIAFAGTVISSTPNSLTVQQKDKDPVTLRLLTDTKFYVDGKLVANPPAFKAGEAVRIVAHTDPDGTLHALRVAVGTTKKADRETLLGTITGSAGADLSVKDTNGNPAIIVLTASTKYLVNGKPATTEPTFTSGEKVRVVAHQETDGSLTGLVVAVRTK